MFQPSIILCNIMYKVGPYQLEMELSPLEITALIPGRVLTLYSLPIVFRIFLGHFSLESKGIPTLPSKEGLKGLRDHGGLGGWHRVCTLPMISRVCMVFVHRKHRF